MATRELKIRVTTEGAQRVVAMLRGIVSGARKADQDRVRSKARAAKDEERIEERSRRTAAASEEAKRREHRRTTEEHRRQLQAQTREQERAAREQERAARAARLRDARGRFVGGGGRGGGGGGGAGGGGGRGGGGWGFGGVGSDVLGGLGVPLSAGAAAGALLASLNAIVDNLGRVTSALEGQAGVTDVGQRTAAAQSFELDLVRLGGEVFGEVDPATRRRELAAVGDEINAIALATNQEPGQLLAALSNLQTEFSAFEFGRQNLQAMAEEAQRTGASVETIARFAGLVNQQFGEMDTARMLDITAQGGLQGALDPVSLSREFAGQLGLFASFVDPERAGSSEDRFRAFVATANVLRQSGLEANESATLMQNLFASLSREEVQKKIRRASGVDIRNFRDESGRLDLAGFVEELEASGRFGSLETIMRSMGDQQASQALNTLISARTRNLTDPEDNADIRELMNVSAAEGAAFRASNLADVRDTAVERQRKIGIAGLVEGHRQAGARGARAEMSMRIGENLTQMGPMADALLGNGLFTESAAALANSSLGRAILDSDLGRAAVGSATMSVMGGNANLLEQGLVAVSSAREQQSAATAGSLKPATPGKSELALETASQDRLAQRIGQEVARSLRDGPNPGNRTPGGG